MAPVRVDGCFGWLHAPAAEARIAGLAAILCSPLEPDARWTHRTLRKLADRLASLGVPTLRFDLPGTGDSRDLGAGEDLPGTWQGSLDGAIDEAKARTGAERVVLLGLRFGALLAADAAARRGDVAALALLGPVASGRAYVRELKVAACAARFIDPSPGGGIEIGGMALSGATLAGLGRLSLPMPADYPGLCAKPILLLDAERRSVAYADALRGAGAALTHAEFEGYGALMASTTANRVPYGALDIVARWLADAVLPLAGEVEAPVPRPALPDAAGTFDGCREEPLRFGSGDHLFGMLCRPAAGPLPELAVLIFNTGGDPHYGIGRLGVRIARRLAAEGIASLRMDFAGLGDSRFGPDDDTAHLFETDRKPDIDAAVAVLERLGASRFGATGICAGAYHAFHAAVADDRFVGIAPINMTTFAWRTGESVEDGDRQTRRSTQFYREGLLRPRNWRRLVRGQVGVPGILRALSLRAGRQLRSAGLSLAERVMPGRLSPTPRRMVRVLAGRGVRVMMVISFEDASLDALTEHFGKAGRDLAASPGMSVHVLRDADHNLSTDRMRRTVVDLLAGHFASTAGPAVTGGRPPSGAGPAEPRAPHRGAGGLRRLTDGGASDRLSG